MDIPFACSSLRYKSKLYAHTSASYPARFALRMYGGECGTAN